MDSVRQGDRLRLKIQLQQVIGGLLVPVTGIYDGSESLTITARLGDGLAAASLANSTAQWATFDAANVPTVGTAGGTAGTILITLDGTDTAALSVLVYRLELTLASGGQTVRAWSGLLDVQPRAAAAAALATGPATFEDMHRAEPALREFILEDPSQRSDLSEFLGAAWLRYYRRAIRERVRRRLERYHEGHLPAAGGDPILPDDYGWSQQDLEDRIDAVLVFVDDGSSLQTDDGEAAEIIARDALARLLAAQVGTGGEPTGWQKRAAAHAARRDSLLLGHIARIDVGDADGRLLVLPA